MSVLLRKQYSSIKKEKLSEQAKSVLKSMYETTNGFKDAKATRKIKPKFEAFYNKLKESKPEAIVGGKAKSKAAPKKSADDFKAARDRRKKQTGVPRDKKAVEKDATRPAISKRGKRTSKAGNTYYEYRDNRLDKNPSKYPMLEKGGFVAVGEKDGYWTVISKPTTKEKAQEMIDLGGLPRGESGKVVTLKEAKEHKKVIGKEYLEKGGYMAAGGELNLGIRKMAQEEGFTPKELGKEYQLVIGQAVVEALTDANYHNEARKLVSILEKNPKIAEKPNYPSPSDPKFNEKMDEIEKEYASEYWDADEKTRRFAIKVSQKSGWDGYAIASAFEYLVRIDGGYHKLADAIEKAMESNEEMAKGGYMAKGGAIGEYRIVPNKKDGMYVVSDSAKAFTISGSQSEAEKSAQKFVIENSETHPTAVVIKLHPSGQPLKNKKVSYVTKDEFTKFEEGGYMAKGGETHRLDSVFEDGGEIAEGNLQMAMSNVKAIEHHAKELQRLLDENTSIEAWVVAKLERAETDLSDVTHYIDGLKGEEVESDTYFAKGGSMPNNYEGKSDKEVWDSWSYDQKYHFLTDHKNHKLNPFNKSLNELSDIADKSSYDELPKNIALALNDHTNWGQYADGGKTIGYTMYYEPYKNLGGKSIQTDEEIRGNFKAMDAVLDKKLGDSYLGANFNTSNGYGKVLLDDKKNKDVAEYVLNMFDFEDVTHQYTKEQGGMMAKGGRLSRKQKQLDLNKNGKLDAQDFKMLRAGRKNARKK